MLPDDVLSSVPVGASFIGARALPSTLRVDHEDGPYGVQDPSRGMQYQRWRAQLIGDDVWLEATNTAPFIIYSGADISEISFSFDQNGRYLLAFVQADLAKLYWYDSIVPGYTVTDMAADVITPRLALDDKRDLQTDISDVILGYVRGGALYWRQQRDRFLIEYFGASGPYPGLLKCGMNRKLRFQFAMATS